MTVISHNQCLVSLLQGNSTYILNFVIVNICGLIPTDLMRRQEELRRLEELRNQELQKRKQVEMRCAFIPFFLMVLLKKKKFL